MGTLLRPGQERTPPGPALERADAEALLVLAGSHLVTPALWSALRSSNRTALLPDDLAEYLEAMHALNARRNRRLREQALEIAATLGAVGIRPVFLKGLAALLLDLHGDPAARFIGDIDVLIRPDRVEDAADALQRAGYQRLPDRVPHAHDQVRVARDDRPALIELHQSPTLLALAALVSTADVLRRARPVDLPGGPVFVPCPDDLVVHNVAHAMVHDLHFRLADLPLRDALDLAQLAHRFAGAIDWPDVARRLQMAPGGSDVLAFYATATAEVFAGSSLPAFAPGSVAAGKLARWRRRNGRPPSRLSSAVTYLTEYAEDWVWRLKHVPSERRRLLRRLASPWTYPRFLRFLATVAAGGQPAPSPGRLRTGTSTRSL